MAAPKPLFVGMKYIPAYNGDEGLVMYFPEAATQTFVVGDLVYLNAGLVTIATTDGSLAGAVLGMAESNGVNAGVAATHYARVRVFRPGDLFSIRLPAAVSYAYGTHLGNSYGIRQNVAGDWYLDTTNTTQKRAQVVAPLEMSPDNAAITPFSGVGGDMLPSATIGGPVIVKILAHTTYIWYAQAT